MEKGWEGRVIDPSEQKKLAQKMPMFIIIDKKFVTLTKMQNERNGYDFKIRSFRRVSMN